MKAVPLTHGFLAFLHRLNVICYLVLPSKAREFSPIHPSLPKGSKLSRHKHTCKYQLIQIVVTYMVEQVEYFGQNDSTLPGIDDIVIEGASLY